MIRGRPVRFVALLLGGWTSVRITLLVAGQTGPVVPSGPMLAAAPPQAEIHRRLRPMAAVRRSAFVAGASPSPLVVPLRSPIQSGRAGWSAGTADLLLQGALAFVSTPRSGLALGSYAPGAGFAEAEQQLPSSRARADTIDRWHGTAWILWRPEGPATATLAPRLGGSQAGARVDYALAPGALVYGRVTGALERPVATEAAAGVALRPAPSLPVSIGIERRQALSAGARSDFAALVAGGVDSQHLARGLWINGYAQAGVVGTRARDGFIDGRLGVERLVGPSDPTVGGSGRAAIGASLWGGAQPGADRLDIGPRARLDMTVAGMSLRVGAEWRERIAGRARPSSGFALVAGADF